ncbi:NADH:flavin oxidoreductase/NADH oxidase [Vararia minispora EC-137]|uniref:NADH:flavin oxidoreductase/NADH oxidase n=1 Tax=Vararia minispora EC-137 TaxID=1314806 RepID=A0ACB8Q7Z6_9AGAM|nr:NADH:flavin oxidoreductase/NADH oxidase [Vararia minispora EC-137]
MSGPSTPALFESLRIGTVQLQHRMVMAPMSRYRSTDAHVPTELGEEYYGQRAHTPGSLLITEGVYVADIAGGQPNAPGVWSDEQVEAWKRITDRVHGKGSFIYLQLWALGRAGYPDILAQRGFPYVSASSVPLSRHSVSPRPLTIPEIKEYVRLYAVAAHNAVNRAGFDGVEIHSANGYLIDQFLQTTSNARSDEYGGSVEGRTRFAREVIEAVVGAVGASHTGIRFSPWGTFQDMGMLDPIPTFSSIVSHIRDAYPEMAYIHVVEPDEEGKRVELGGGQQVIHSNDFIRKLWLPRPLICTNGFERDTAIKAAEMDGVLVGFARKYLANPDLVERFKSDLPLNTPDYPTFYSGGAKGYIDYPFTSDINQRGTASRL